MVNTSILFNFKTASLPNKCLACNRRCYTVAFVNKNMDNPTRMKVRQELAKITNDLWAFPFCDDVCVYSFVQNNAATILTAIL